MFELCGYVSASQLQSIYQLGTAVALTFLVAGPEVRKILAKQLADFGSLSETLVTLSQEGWADAGPRIELCHIMKDLIENGDIDPVKVNFRTNAWYITMAIVSFWFLVMSSIFQHIPVSMAWVGITFVVIILFVDPVRTAFASHKASTLAALVATIAKTQDHNDPTADKVARAKSVMVFLRQGRVTLNDAIAQLNKIEGGASHS